MKLSWIATGSFAAVFLGIGFAGGFEHLWWRVSESRRRRRARRRRGLVKDGLV